jgi:hypothetical protein
MRRCGLKFWAKCRANRKLLRQADMRLTCPLTCGNKKAKVTKAMKQIECGSRARRHWDQMAQDLEAMLRCFPLMTEWARKVVK